MKPTLILTSDWHLREDTPACRTDDFWQAQTRAMDFIVDLAEEHDCPVVIAGDVFDHWKHTHHLVSHVSEHMPREVYAIPGQHDLPNHLLKEAPKSALYVLFATGRVHSLNIAQKSVVGHPRGSAVALYGHPFGVPVRSLGRNSRIRSVAVCHVLVWHKEKPWPGCEADSAMQMLKKVHGYDLILTGDNHTPFVVRKGVRLLVNPGSLMQTRADQADHKPRVYLWEAESNTVEPVFLPIERNTVSREHIEASEQKEEREQRYQSFVKRLGGKWEVCLSFEDNLQTFFREHKTHEKVKQYILEAINV